MSRSLVKASELNRFFQTYALQSLHNEYSENIWLGLVLDDKTDEN